MTKIEDIRVKFENFIVKLGGSTHTKDDVDVVISYLKELEKIPIDRDILQNTKIGVTLSKLAKRNTDNDISELSASLIKKWKNTLRSETQRSVKKQKFHNSSEDDMATNVKEDEDLRYKGKLHNDELRDKALNYLFKSFMIGQNCSAEALKVYDIIYEVELFLYDVHICRNKSQKEYNSQLKAIAFNLKDVNNPTFNAKIYNGEVTPEQLATMKSVDMASDEKKLLRNSILQESIQACQSDWDVKNIFLQKNNNAKGQFYCTKCKSSNTMYYQMQTRSSDEPMTTFVSCINCQNRWRF